MSYILLLLAINEIDLFYKNHHVCTKLYKHFMLLNQ